MSREVPFDPKARCDKCGREGAYDFMGDLMCDDCIKEATDKEAADGKRS